MSSSIAGVLSVLLACAPLVARAEWEIHRADDDPRVLAALLAALLAAPDDRAALRRLVARASGKDRLVRLAERCEAEARGLGRLACGHLRREAHDPTHALARYREAAAMAPDDARPHRAASEILQQQARPDEALVELEAARARATPAMRPAILEALIAAYGSAHTPGAAERRHAATAAAEELLALRPTDIALKRHLAEALAALGEHARAAQWMAELARSVHDPQLRAPFLLRAAQLYEEAQRGEDAAAAIERALALLGPHDPRRRSALDEELAIERRRERLPQLAARWGALPASQRDAGLEELLGRVLDELGDGAGARHHLERATALDPRALAPRRLLIRLHGRAGDEDAAVAELRRLVTAAHGEPAPALELAERLFARPGGAKEALALAEDVGRRHRDPTTHAALAALYDKWGDKPRALAEQELLVRLEPEEPEHLVALGELHEQQGDKIGALKIWHRLAPGANAPLPATLRLADVLAEHDQAGEALSLLERAAHDHTGDTSIERRLADVLDRLHRDGEAEAIYRRLLDAAVERGDAAFVREAGGRWLELALHRGSLAHELDSLTKAVEAPTKPAEIELAFLVARGRGRDHRGLEAERVLRRILAVAPLPTDRARALEALADLVLSRPGSHAAEAIELMVRAAKEDAARAPALYDKASQRAAELYRDADALTYAERAVALAPLDADAQERLGSLLELRDPARALAAYDRAIELDATRDHLRLRAAELALRRGDEEGAAARYRVLIARARDEQAIEEAARRAVIVHELTGRLGVLEREIAPRATSSGGHANGVPALRRLLIDIERRYVPLLAVRADAGDAAARAELQRVAAHALAPLLDGVLEGDGDERRAAVALLGQLGAKGATPLLLRLAVGETARRGASPPPAELRAAAAEAAAALVDRDDLPRLSRLATDPEQRIRVAASVALARLAAAGDARASALLATLLADDQERVAAAACLGLPSTTPLATPLLARITALALAPDRPLAARACGVAIARRVEHDAKEAQLAVGLVARLRAEPATATEAVRPRLTAGLARALLASRDADAIAWALPQALADLELRHALLGATPRDANAPLASIDVSAWIMAAEALPDRRSALSNEQLDAAFAGATPNDTLADLLASDSLVAHLAAADDEPSHVASARTAILDHALPALTRLAEASTAGAATTRASALALLAERPAGLPVVAEAARRGDARQAVLVALDRPAAAELTDAGALAFVGPLREALREADWRQRRAALACLTRQPALAAALAPERAALRADPNRLVAEAAGPAQATAPVPTGGLH